MKNYTLVFPHDYKPTARSHPSYPQWATMLTRCRNKKVKKYRDYGARGISVCKRWVSGDGEKTGFECFMKDMGNKPTKKHSIDRINNDGNYEKSNCRWATNKDQANNRRSCRVLTYRGESLSMMKMAEKHGLSYFMLRDRISRGWSIEEAMQPIGPSGWKRNPESAAKGESLPQSKLTKERVIEMRGIHSSNPKTTFRELGRMFSVSTACACLCVNRKTWAHIP